MSTSVYSNRGLSNSNDLFWSRLPNGVSVAAWIIRNPSSVLEPISRKRNDLFTVPSTSYSRSCRLVLWILAWLLTWQLVCFKILQSSKCFRNCFEFFRIRIHFEWSSTPTSSKLSANFLPIRRAPQCNLVTSPNMTSSHQNIIKDRWRNDTASKFYLCCSTDSSGRRKKSFITKPLSNHQAQLATQPISEVEEI